MTKLLMGLIGLFIAYGTSILVNIFGWGLEPKSWGWILGGSFIGVMIGALFNMAKDE